jgi:hypothetical protein
MTLRVLASGVDRMELSLRGSVRNEVLTALEVAKLEAQRMREAEPYRFTEGGRWFLVRAGGRRAYPYVLASADMILTLRQNGELPAVRAEILSAYLHEVGAEAACAEVEELAAGALFVVAPDVVVSRVDVYADVQGWALGLRDAERFVSRARKRTMRTLGPRLTGFVFGEGGPLLARVYDKTAEIARKGETWLDRWGERDDEGPVWRVEYQYRRAVLAEFGAREPAEVLAKLQDLWRHGTEEWLTLRVPTGQAESWRWPVDESWTEVQRVTVGPGTGAKRERAAETSRERTVRFLQGYLTTWGALGEADEIEEVWRTARPAVVRYLREQKRTFRDEVRHKRARLRLMGGGAGAPKAREGESLPRIGRSARTARRARAGQSTFLGRPPRTPRAGARTREVSISAEPEIVGESGRGWLEAPSSGEAVNRRGARSRGGAGRSRAGRRRRTEGKDRLPGEGGRTHARGSEVHGPGRRNDGGRARAPVGAEPPTQPEGSERNHKADGGRSVVGEGNER